jgi:thiol-disulfide isomerase/thioredoxin
LTGLFINIFLGFYSKFRKHLHKVEVVSGVMLISIGLLIATNKVSVLNSWLASFLPNPENAVVVTPPQPSGPAPITATNLELAPQIELKNVTGAPFRLSDLRGRVVVLNFWATWCVPCRSEIPELNDMSHELEGQGLSVVGVLWNDPEADIKAFQKEIKQDYSIVVGEDSAGDKFGGVQGLPTTFIIDREGRIRQKIFGPRSREGFEAIVKPLLAESPTTASSK